MSVDNSDSKESTEGPKSQRGLWDGLAKCELVATASLCERLSPVTRGLSLIFEAGTAAPTLGGSRRGEQDVLVSALFLKRALTDLRAVWLLLGMGYTAPAASVAAALYEQSLVIDIVAGSPRYSKKIAESAHGDVPWGAKELCKKYAIALRDRELTKSSDKAFDFESAWKSVYAPYRVLCKIKHPTTRIAIHEASGTLRPDGSYVVMAVPDTRDEDWVFKTTVAGMVGVRLGSAIETFVGALGDCDDTERKETLLGDIKNGRADVLVEMLNAKGPAPFTTKDIADKLGFIANPAHDKISSK